MGVNNKIDGDTIVATMMRNQHQTIDSDCGLMFMPHGSMVLEKFIGYVKTPTSGVIRRAENFVKVTPWQRDYARRLVKFLNYDLHYDGAWSVMWGDPTIDGTPTTIHFAYQDVDGDVAFVVDSTRSLVELMQTNDVRSHGQNADKAHREWKAMMKDVEVRKDQTIKAALGEQPLDPNVQPII